MATKLLYPSYAGCFNQKFRQKRIVFFTSLLQKMRIQAPIQILDLGGTESYWERMGFGDRSDVHVTLLNLNPV